MIEQVVPSDIKPRRLDVYLAEELDQSRSQIRRWIESGFVLHNGKQPTKSGVLVRGGDQIKVLPDRPTHDMPAEARPQPLPLSVIYEDEHVIVINKPKGMVVHPAAGHAQGTVVNALLHHAPEIMKVGSAYRPGIVHRLDKDTSGIMIAAKSEEAFTGLTRGLKERRVERTYVALVHGCPKQDRATIAASVGRHPVDRQKMAVLSQGGKPAVTHFEVRECLDEYAMLEVNLETGRTHQIRVHLAYIGHPVVGDTKYGPKRPHLFSNGQALHAYRLGFVHPVTGIRMDLKAPLPAGFQKVLRDLGSSYVDSLFLA